MRFLLSLLLLLGSSQLSIAQIPLSLSEALEKERISIGAKGNGGYRGKALHLWVKNQTDEPLIIQLEPGHQFASLDTNIQDLMLTAPLTLELAPAETQTVDAYTMCTQSHNMSPYRGANFVLVGQATGDVHQLAQTIAENDYQNSTAQSALWAMIEKEGYEDVFGEDVEMVRTLATQLAQAHELDMSNFDLHPRRHVLTQINASMEALLAEDLSDARLVLIGPEGQLMRTYFEGRKIERGFMQWKVGIAHTLDTAAVLRLQIRQAGQVIAEKEITRGDTVMPLHRYQGETMMGYEVPEDLRADIGIYDSLGHLYYLVAEGRPLRKGYTRGRYGVGKDLPRDRTYFIQVRAKGSVLAERILDPEAAPLERHPVRTVSGELSLEIERPLRDAKVAIYDSRGQLKRKLYDIDFMKPGTKRFSYRFQHVDGPGATFELRITDKNGVVVHRILVQD